MNCQFCGEVTNNKIKVPSFVLVDQDSNIKEVALNDEIECCKECHKKYIKKEDKYDITVNYFTNRIYRDGRKRIIYKFLAPLLHKKKVPRKKAKKIVEKWLRKNYDKYPSNSGENVSTIISWAKGVVDWAYRNKRHPSFKALKGLKYEVDI